jgi:hypothetical protein
MSSGSIFDESLGGNNAKPYRACRPLSNFIESSHAIISKIQESTRALSPMFLPVDLGTNVRLGRVFEQSLQRRQQFFRFGAAGVVGVDLGVGDHPALPDCPNSWPGIRR